MKQNESNNKNNKNLPKEIEAKEPLEAKNILKKRIKSFFILTTISLGLIAGGFIYTYFASKQIDKKYNAMED